MTPIDADLNAGVICGGDSVDLGIVSIFPHPWDNSAALTM